MWKPRRWYTTALGLGITQIIGWGSALYFPAAMGQEIAKSLGTRLEYIFGGVSAMYVVGALIAPWIGRKIDTQGARPIMVLGSLLAAASFLSLSTAQTLFHYLGSWLLLGGMLAASLSNAAYAALAQAALDKAQRAFTILILATGLAGTICLPAIYAVGKSFGWRPAALMIGGLHLLICMPLHWFVLPRFSRQGNMVVPENTSPFSEPALDRAARTAFTVLSVSLAFNIFVTTGLSLHLVGILTAANLSQDAAIILTSAVGPIQVMVRATQIIAGNLVNPIVSGLVGAGFLPLAIFILFLSIGTTGTISYPAAAGFAVLFAVSNALMVVARAAIPYFVFGAMHFGRWAGLLATSQNLASAATPIAFAFALEKWNAQGAVLVALAASVISFTALAVLGAIEWRPPGMHPPSTARPWATDRCWLLSRWRNKRY
ncbi:MFS transporter [Xanthomonas campestris pv. phormiicola]|nr:MFS transporter [Xanthomonas campestris pv. phormiicola]